MGVEQVGELLAAATADVPENYRAAPLAAIARRIRRRRAWAAAAAAAVTVAVLLGGVAVARAAVPGATAHPAGTASPSSDSPSAEPVNAASAALPWASVMVSRDNRTLTVYGGVTGCRSLAQAHALLTSQDSTQVVIGVYGQPVAASDCSTAGRAVPLVVTLSAPLGTRIVRDATGGQPPVYHQRDLPDVTATGWSPFENSWQANDVAWHAGFNGPAGTSIFLSAQPDHSTPYGAPVTTVRLGTHQGAIFQGFPGAWQVNWLIGGVSYSLQYEPTEGGSFTLGQFKQLLTTLHWS